MTFDREQAIEVIARSFAESVTAITVRRGGEPVDVCRFHRDLAEDFVDALADLPPALPPVVDDAMVERAAKAIYAKSGFPPSAWAMDGTPRGMVRGHARAALLAALSPERTTVGESR